RLSLAHINQGSLDCTDIPPNLLRKHIPKLPELSELEVVRHFTRLSSRNFSIDTHFYPLGSCTMKYNPRAAHRLASLCGLLQRHPYQPVASSQGYLACLYELQGILAEVVGMDAVSLTPMAGSQGELAGVMMMMAYHRQRQDFQRTEMLIPDAAHGTNPASAAMCGLKVVEVATTKAGDLDLEALSKLAGSKTAGIMLTNPSTFGVFERQIHEIAKIVHHAGGLLYYDGANLNAILGQVRPGDMGFDVMHLNLHKTFATPHGGGGPGAGPVAANKKLQPYLPIPIVGRDPKEGYRWLEMADCPLSIGRLSAFMGNSGVLLRAYIYARMLGKQGLQRVSQYAVLNANYLMNRLEKIGYTLAFPQRRATHEFIITVKPLTLAYGVTAQDIAKRLLDYQCYAPTIYFPQLVPECLLIEPTETESKQTLDRFIEVMALILQEARERPQILKQAPHNMVVGRLDEVKAARDLNVSFYEQEQVVT
ncbi:MAG: aminomethyl-transferring glycine dehydrogenase subunit GcvPB, partial [Proteobacteria bacterium]|nr:aminomethyl-transferring glycine dehydrogenase subunit GcvPB [Pseudomonadota bacterium]